MQEPGSESPLEHLRRQLYGQEPPGKRREFNSPLKNTKVPEHWEHAPEMTQAPQLSKKKMSATTLFLIGAATFFILAGIATAVVLFLGGRSLSSDNVEILIEGPTTIEGGEEVSLLITLQNDNPLPVTDATLSIDFPEGTYANPSQTEELPYYSEAISTIPAGASVRKTIRATFFGSENQQMSIPITLEYKTESSNAVFVKRKQYDLVLGTPPISISITSLSETAPGQEFEVELAVRSNAAATLENIAVQASYPTGFRATRTSPEPIGDNLFPLGRLRPGEVKEVTINGTLTGQEGDERVFKFAAGSLQAASSTSLAVSYTTENTEIRIAKPFLSLGLQLNREQTPSIVLAAGETVDGILSWTNVLAAPILDATILITLKGDALDKGTVDAEGGFYRSSDSTLVFSKETDSSLARLEPGAKGSATFRFLPKTGTAISSLRNPVIDLEVSVSGRRIGEGNVPETITSTVTRSVKVETDLTLTSDIVRTVGPFTNTGPWPAKVDTESTYTVRFRADNTVNSTARTAAVMRLPSYVRYTGTISQGSAITYNETTRDVTWTIGDLGAGASREAAFQIAFLPSLSQKGTSPVLVSEQTLVGLDRFTQTEVKDTAPSLSTQAKNDPAYTINHSNVQ
jgi:hypothetical protein